MERKIYMKAKRFVSIAIFIVAIGIGAFVVYDNLLRADPNQELLDEYLNSGGIERTTANGDVQEYEEKDEVGVDPGMMAPDFSLPNLHGGNPITLSDFRGDYVVVNMWATWCGPCRDEMPDFIDFYENYKDDGVEMIGINMTTQERNIEAIDQFADDFNIPFHLPLDEDGGIIDDYEIHVMPTTYLINPDGRVAVKRLGLINYETLENYYLEIKEDYEKKQSS